MFKNILTFILTYALCLFYSTWIGLGIAIAYIFKRQTKFWIPKSRPNPPAVLTGNQYGEHKFANVNGIKLHYVAKGDPKKPLIVFVHGFPEFWYSWRYQIEEFSKDYYTVAIDQRGFGQSDKPPKISDYKVNNMIDDIRELVKFLGREKFILIAHDWGAVVGFGYVRKYMNTLDKYVMIGAPPMEVWAKSVFSTLKQFLMSWYIFFYQMPCLPEFALRSADMRLFKVMELSSDDQMEAYKYTFGKEGAFTAPINYYRANVGNLFPDPIPPRPKQFVPGLFMLGENEKYISFDTGEKAKRKYEKLEFKTIEGANHFAQQHKPEATNRLIREFLEKK